MEFAYTPRLVELKDRARTLTEKIMPFELEWAHRFVSLRKPRWESL